MCRGGGLPKGPPKFLTYMAIKKTKEQVRAEIEAKQENIIPEILRLKRDKIVNKLKEDLDAFLQEYIGHLQEHLYRNFIEAITIEEFSKRLSPRVQRALLNSKYNPKDSILVLNRELSDYGIGGVGAKGMEEIRYALSDIGLNPWAKACIWGWSSTKNFNKEMTDD